MIGSLGGHIVGEVIGNKTLAHYNGKNFNNHHVWLWTCNLCGDISGPSTIAHLKRSNRCKRSCNQGEGNPRWQGHQGITGKAFNSYKYNAKKRDIEFNISIEELWQIFVNQDKKCIYTGVNLAHGINASPDRIDSNLGYVPGNVQWVEINVNRMKSNFSHDYFLNMCNKIAKHQGLTE